MNKTEAATLKAGDSVERETLMGPRVYDVISVEDVESTYGKREYVLTNKASKRAFIIRDEDILMYKVHTPFFVEGVSYEWQGSAWGTKPTYVVESLRKNDKGEKFAIVRVKSDGDDDTWSVLGEYDFKSLDEVKS